MDEFSFNLKVSQRIVICIIVVVVVLSGHWPL